MSPPLIEPKKFGGEHPCLFPFRSADGNILKDRRIRFANSGGAFALRPAPPRPPSRANGATQPNRRAAPP